MKESKQQQQINSIQKLLYKILENTQTWLSRGDRGGEAEVRLYKGASGSFPGGSEGKESACNAGDPGLIPALERSPGGGHSNPLQYFLPGKSHGWRSLASYSPWT